MGMESENTMSGLEKYDKLDPRDAVLMAWVNPGRNPRFHLAAQRRVRVEMPLLARALDRRAADFEAQGRPVPKPLPPSGGGAKMET